MRNEQGFGDCAEYSTKKALQPAAVGLVADKGPLEDSLAPDPLRVPGVEEVRAMKSFVDDSLKDYHQSRHAGGESRQPQYRESRLGPLRVQAIKCQTGWPFPGGLGLNPARWHLKRKWRRHDDNRDAIRAAQLKSEGLTQQQISVELKVSQSCVSRWLKGRVVIRVK